jgi:hypothetical protein
MSDGSVAAAVAAAGAVVVLALWVLVLARLVRRTARMPLALTAFASAWALCCMMVRLRFPGWALLPGAGAVFVSIILLVPVAQMSLFNDTGSGGEESGEGGGGTRPPDRPTDGGGPAEPSWWPEFEQDLAGYLAERERAEQEVPVAQ